MVKYECKYEEELTLETGYLQFTWACNVPSKPPPPPSFLQIYLLRNVGAYSQDLFLFLQGPLVLLRHWAP